MYDLGGKVVSDDDCRGFPQGRILENGLQVALQEEVHQIVVLTFILDLKLLDGLRDRHSIILQYQEVINDVHYSHVSDFHIEDHQLKGLVAGMLGRKLVDVRGEVVPDHLEENLFFLLEKYLVRELLLVELMYLRKAVC